MLTVVKLMTSFQTNCFGFVSTLFSPIVVQSYFVEAPPSPIPFHISPCIMCVQYHGGDQYHGGCLVPWGISWVPWGISWVLWRDILSTVEGGQYRGGYLEYCGGYLEYCGGYLEYRGGYHEYHGGYRVLWGIQYRGGYHGYRGGYHGYRGGCSVPWGESFVIWVPHGTEHPMVLMISPTYPPWYSWYFPTCIMISPHGTQDIPHIYHGIPPRYSRYPHGTQDIPPWYSWYPPTVLMISPMVLMISPTVLNTTTVLHTHYTGWFAKL